MGKSGEKLEKVVKSWKKWRKVGISGESWGKEGKSWKLIFFAKWPPAAILDDQKSLSITFLAISDQYATFFFDFFFKMAAGRHFGIPFLAILDDQKSLSIAFLAISDQYATFFFLNIFFKMAASGYFGSPICAKNNRVLPLCVINGYAKYEVDR